MAKKKDDDLDLETTIVDMNVEGFSWYDPSRKKSGGKRQSLDVTPKERRAMVRGAFLALLPFIGCLVLAMSAAFLLVYLWLK